MKINKFRNLLYKTSKYLGDYQAVKNKKVDKRIQRRIAGKIVGKLFRKLFK